MDAMPDAFPRQVLHGRLRRGEQERGEMIGHDPVPLLRHRAVVGTQTCFDVGDRDVVMRCRQSARCGRVRVPVDEDDVGELLREHLVKRDHHAPDHRSGRPTVDPEVLVGVAQSERGELRRGQRDIMMLARMDQALDDSGSCRQLTTHGCGFDELRTRTDDGQHLHGHLRLPPRSAVLLWEDSGDRHPVAKPPYVPVVAGEQMAAMAGSGSTVTTGDCQLDYRRSREHKLGVAGLVVQVVSSPATSHLMMPGVGRFRPPEEQLSRSGLRMPFSEQPNQTWSPFWECASACSFSRQG